MPASTSRDATTKIVQTVATAHVVVCSSPISISLSLSLSLCFSLSLSLSTLLPPPHPNVLTPDIQSFQLFLIRTHLSPLLSCAHSSLNFLHQAYITPLPARLSSTKPLLLRFHSPNFQKLYRAPLFHKPTR
jgi:hypothetical protein